MEANSSRTPGVRSFFRKTFGYSVEQDYYLRNLIDLVRDETQRYQITYEKRDYVISQLKKYSRELEKEIQMKKEQANKIQQEYENYKNTDEYKNLKNYQQEQMNYTNNYDIRKINDDIKNLPRKIHENFNLKNTTDLLLFLSSLDITNGKISFTDVNGAPVVLTLNENKNYFPFFDMISNPIHYYCMSNIPKEHTSIKCKNMGQQPRREPAPSAPAPSAPAPSAPAPIIDEIGTPNCPSAGQNPANNIPYNKQVLTFYPDKNQDAVNAKFLELKNKFNRAGGYKRSQSKRSQSKRSQKYKRAINKKQSKKSK